MRSNTAAEDGVSSSQYPRTGKRGVPQQFPRRLYEMLQSESKLIQASPDHPKIIIWSESGKAFGISDVAEFSTTILPKYFRTKKFSSFQRNLNLYGFAKVRRGADVDMYAHPSFRRDQTESLSELRKLTSTTNRRRNRGVSVTKHHTAKASRSVSPSPTLILARAQLNAPPMARISPPVDAAQQLNPSYASPKHTYVWPPIHKVPLSPEASSDANMGVADQSPWKNDAMVGRGRLDLLALAMEQAAAMQ